jgi:hypothetical protein
MKTTSKYPYDAIHVEHRQSEGKASQYLCALCGVEGQQRALKPDADGPLFCAAGLWWSADPDQYVVLCAHDHRTLDAWFRRWRACVWEGKQDLLLWADLNDMGQGLAAFIEQAVAALLEADGVLDLPPGHDWLLDVAR